MQIIYLSKKELSNTAFGTVQVETWRAEVAGQVHRAFSGRPNWICLFHQDTGLFIPFMPELFFQGHLYYSKSHFDSF